VNTVRISVQRSVIFAGLILCAAAPVVRASQFLSAEIEAALAPRTAFLQRAGLTDSEFLNFIQWVEGQGRERFAGRLEELSEEENPWYYFLNGLLDAENANTYYGYAVDAASPDPGALWLLALEFIRNDLSPWAATAFTELEKQIFARGAVSAPLLSQQLMLFGNILAPQYPADADFCYTWAGRFDHGQCWWLYKKATLDLPNNLASGIPAFIAGAAGTFVTSWRAQLELVSGIYRFFSVTLFIFTCAVILLFMVKYLPSGSHTMGDWLFHGASPRFRTISSIIIVLSVLPLGFAPLFGLIPFLWIGVFLVRRFLTAPEKKLLTLACVILAVTPLDALITNFFRRQAAPDSTSVVFDRAASEGFSSGLHKLAAANAVNRPDSPADQLALAISFAKMGEDNYRQTADALRKALQLAPSDPMVLMYAGNISFWAGNIDVMGQFYSRLLEKQPNNAAAKYNYAQSLINKGGFTASDAVSEATDINASLISEFIRANDHYYSVDVPPLRRLILTTVTPGYFWGSLFFSGVGEALKVRGWAPFFGLSPVLTFVLFAALLAALLVLDVTLWSNRSRVKKYFTCRICGRMICRKCRKGSMCSSCYRECLKAHNNAAAMYSMQKKCQDRSVLRKDITGCLLDMFVPGTGRLYIGKSVFKPAITILITSTVFAACWCLFAFRTNYPSLTVINPVYCVPALLIYNAVAFFRYGAGMVKVLQNYAKKHSKGGG